MISEWCLSDIGKKNYSRDWILSSFATSFWLKRFLLVEKIFIG
jgi:hypothetical protein